MLTAVETTLESAVIFEVSAAATTSAPVAATAPRAAPVKRTDASARPLTLFDASAAPAARPLAPHSALITNSLVAVETCSAPSVA